MSTTPDIYCINVLLESPNGNVQLVFDNFMKANSTYDALVGAMLSGNPVAVESSYGEKAQLQGAKINTVLFADVAKSKRGAAELSMLHDIANVQYQSRLAAHPTIKAANLSRNFMNGMGGPANG